MRTWRLGATVIVLSVAAIACSTKSPAGDAGATPTAGGGTTPSSSSRPSASGSAVLVAADFSFTPTLVTIRSSQRLDLVNQGSVTHNFSIGSQHIDVDTPKGARTTLAKLPAGRYTFFCKYHRGQGMMGTLIIQ